MDLNDLKPKSDTLQVILLHPATQEPILKEDKVEMSITVYLPHSAKYKEAAYEQVNRRLAKMQKKGKQTPFTAEEMENTGLELLAKVTKDWDIVLGGKKPKLDVPTAMDIYRSFPWIKDQVEEGINDATNFTKT